MKKLFILSCLFIGQCFAAPEFKSEVQKFESLNKKGGHILVHVHADWCPTCIRQKRILQKLDQSQFDLIQIDFDKDKSFLGKHQITQQSMLISFNNGQEVKRKFGISKEEDIKTFIEESFSPSLNDKLQEKKSQSKIPQDTRAIMERANQKLKDLGIIDKAKNIGDTFIDFALPNIHNKPIKISDLLKNGPVILTFYRGGWCPYCNLQLKAYQESLAEFKAAGGQLVAISPESMQSAETTVNKNEIQYEILSDDHNKIARQYGLVFKLDDELKEIYLKFGLDLEKNQGNKSWELPIPATYVIDKNGKIRYAFLNVDYVQRAEPKDIIEVLNKL